MFDWQARAACALALTLLAGCGQKGALYLPDRAGSVVSRPGETLPPRTAAPAPAAPAPATPATPAPVAPVSKPPDDGSASTDDSPRH
jgi:predicted small lipoprotein YifL